MRKANCGILVALAVLTSAALAATARAQDAMPVAATSAEPVPPPRRKIEVGVSFLPMSLGRFTSTPGGMKTTLDAKLAPGISISAGYEVLPGLVVGVAPQVIWDVRWKEAPEGALVINYREDDFMARVAYGCTLAGVRLYAEVLPGYSRLIAQNIDTENSTGFVIAAGAGAAMDLGDRMFVNLAGGYQWGFQKQPADLQSAQIRSQFVRFALGVGARF